MDIEKVIEELKWYRESYQALAHKINYTILKYSKVLLDPNFENKEFVHDIIKSLAEKTKVKPFPNNGIQISLKDYEISTN